MSARVEERVLLRLAAHGAVLARDRDGIGYGVFTGGDRRRRPTARLLAVSVRQLEADGVIVARGKDAFVLSDAGRARLRREDDDVGEAPFLAQHVELEARVVVDADKSERVVRGVARSNVLRKLAALPGVDGGLWLSASELQAAQMLRNDWEASQAGLTRGSDWSAPPIGSSRGASNAQERAMAARCDRARRVADALNALAPPLRRIVERVCLNEDGLEAIERGEGWPSRSAKLALKLGLAQLAQAFAR